MSNPNKINQTTINKSESFNLDGLYKAGGIAAIIIVIVVIIEIAITFFPEGSKSAGTVVEGFVMFQNNWFLGLRNLGLLNIIIIVLGIPIFLALYFAHLRINRAYLALIAMIISFIGIAVFLATNRAFPMLELSSQFASATTDAQKSILTAAGQSMLSVGKSHTPGFFLISSYFWSFGRSTYLNCNN